MSQQPNRQPQGIPTGGQFAPDAKGRASVSLDGPAATAEDTAAPNTPLVSVAASGPEADLRWREFSTQYMNDVTSFGVIAEEQATSGATLDIQVIHDPRYDVGFDYQVFDSTNGKNLGSGIASSLGEGKAKVREILGVPAPDAHIAQPNPAQDMPWSTVLPTSSAVGAYANFEGASFTVARRKNPGRSSDDWVWETRIPDGEMHSGRDADLESAKLAAYAAWVCEDVRSCTECGKSYLSSDETGLNADGDGSERCTPCGEAEAERMHALYKGGALNPVEPHSGLPVTDFGGPIPIR